MSTEFDIVIVGAGVVGVTTAINLQRKYPNAKITIITEKLSPYTTGDGSAGFWMPYLCGGTPEKKLLQWSGDTLKYFHHLWRSELAEIAGVSYLPVICLSDEYDDKQTQPAWLSICIGVHEIPLNTIQKLMKEHGKHYRQGICFTSFTCEPSKLLPYLMKEFLNNGGQLVISQITSLPEVVKKYSDATKKLNIVVNCCGLSARTVVPDETVLPIRGQVARVHAPWLFHIMFNQENYMIPNQHCAILGGTQQRNNYSTEVDVNDSKMIFGGCQSMVPGLKSSPTLTEWVGLRPGRESVRLEIDTKMSTCFKTLPSDKNNKSSLLVIHNYGHGGSGVTLCWGCAIDVTNILDNALIDLNVPTTNESIRSRL